MPTNPNGTPPSVATGGSSLFSLGVVLGASDASSGAVSSARRGDVGSGAASTSCTLSMNPSAPSSVSRASTSSVPPMTRPLKSTWGTDEDPVMALWSFSRSG